MKVQRDDPAAVRAGKWAQRWEWERFARFLSACCKLDGDGWVVLPEFTRVRWQSLSMLQYSGAPACRARALLWRREVAHLREVDRLEDAIQEGAWASWGEDL